MITKRLCITVAVYTVSMATVAYWTSNTRILHWFVLMMTIEAFAISKDPYIPMTWSSISHLAFFLSKTTFKSHLRGDMIHSDLTQWEEMMSSLFQRSNYILVNIQPIDLNTSTGQPILISVTNSEFNCHFYLQYRHHYHHHQYCHHYHHLLHYLPC